MLSLNDEKFGVTGVGRRTTIISKAEHSTAEAASTGGATFRNRTEAIGLETDIEASDLAPSRVGDDLATSRTGDDVAKSRQGDGEAYARIVREHQAQVARRMRLFAREPATVDELVQEVFVNAYFSLAGFRGAGTFEAWLARIATRVGYRHWKRSRRRKDEINRGGDWWRGLAAEPVDEFGPRTATRLVQELLEQLPPRDRLVLLLLHVEGHSTAEAAQLAGWSQTMIKVQAHRARHKLRALFARLGIHSVRTAMEAAGGKAAMGAAMGKAAHERT